MRYFIVNNRNVILTYKGVRIHVTSIPSQQTRVIVKGLAEVSDEVGDYLLKTNSALVVEISKEQYDLLKKKVTQTQHYLQEKKNLHRDSAQKAAQKAISFPRYGQPSVDVNLFQVELKSLTQTNVQVVQKPEEVINENKSLFNLTTLPPS